MNPEHNRTNPQRAIDERKRDLQNNDISNLKTFQSFERAVDEHEKSTYGHSASCGTGLNKPPEGQAIDGLPPILQRAIDEYKKSMPKKDHASIDIWANELKKDYPIVRLGQGRDEVPEGDRLIEAVFVLICTFAGIAGFLFLCYLGKVVL